MNFALSDKQLALKDRAREFTDREIVPRAGQNDRDSHFDLDLLKKLAKAGYLGTVIPESYGGSGLSRIDYALILEEIGRGCSAMRTAVSVQTSLVAETLVRFGTEEQKQRYLPLLCSGEWLASFALTEPGSGSDAANQQTRANQTDRGWELTGEKKWVSLGSHAKLALVFAQTAPELGNEGLACFLVETGTAGFSAEKISGKLGLRGSDTAKLFLNGVAVPKSALLGEVGMGLKIALSALNAGRYSVAAGCVGICRASLEASVQYAQTRKQFGKQIGEFQLIQAKIADLVVATEAARMLVFKAGDLKDRKLPNAVETSTAKLYATEAAVSCADTAIQIHGGAGYSDEYPVERYLRDARVTTLYEGTSEIQKLIIGRAATGIDAFT